MSKSFRTLIGTVALIFALLFTAAAIAQYWFLRRGLNAGKDSYLRSSAEEMRDQIAFVDACLVPLQLRRGLSYNIQLSRQALWCLTASNCVRFQRFRRWSTVLLPEE
jgi:hypothetical protein